MFAFCAGMLEAMGVLGLVGLLDITGYLLKEGSNVQLSRTLFRVWLASRYAKLASRYGWLAWRINLSSSLPEGCHKSGAWNHWKLQRGEQVTQLITCAQYLCLSRAFHWPFLAPILSRLLWIGA